MGTVLPSPTLISFSTPAEGDGISASTLSVEISKSGSSRSTLSPGFLSHLVIVPSKILSPIWGITMSTAMIALLFPQNPNTAPIPSRQQKLFSRWAGSDLPASAHTALEYPKRSRAAAARPDRQTPSRTESPRFRPRFRGFQRRVHHRGVGKNRQVFPFAAYHSLPDRHGVISSGNFSLDAPVEKLVLEKEHGVIVAHCGLQQALRVGRRRGINDLQPRRVHEIHFGICRVKRPAVHSAARRPANHHRRGRVPQIMSLGHEICNLVERAHDEVDKLHLHDRPQAEIAHAAGRADDGAFADRRIHHALPAKPRQQSLAGLERPAVHAYVLAEQDHRRVAFHLLEHRLPDGFEKRDLRSALDVSIRSGPVRPGHCYLRAFREALAAAAFTVFFAADFVRIFVPGFRPPADFSAEADVSPK